MKKDLLGQDMLLVGPPGSHAAYRRDLALLYAQLLQKPIHVLTITADLTESDLKQRRELVFDNKSLELQFGNAAPVQAAIHGRLLVLEGIERASRNVLPTLNNLLEHRSMNLEDGRLLVPHERYQELALQEQQHPEQLVPVHPDFRVIATAVPPPWPGRPLDPPLRSRFQIRRVQEPLVEDDDNTEYAALLQAMQFASDSNAQIWPFPNCRWESTRHTLEQFPHQPIHSVFQRAYPMAAVDNDNNKRWNSNKWEPSQTAWKTAWKELKLSSRHQDNKGATYRIDKIVASSTDTRIAEVTFNTENNNAAGDKPVTVRVHCGAGLEQQPDKPKQRQGNFCLTQGLQSVLTAMMQSHAAGSDILLLSPRGESKSAMTLYFASQLLGYPVALVPVVPELTLQDLFLRRVTSESGATSWQPTALLAAIQNGDLCVLDNVEKLRPDVLAALQSLCLDRQLDLPNGQRILRADRADAAMLNHDDETTTTTTTIIRAHPAFRIVALASISSSEESSTSWFTQDVMSMFSTVVIPPPTSECTAAILQSVHPDTSKDTIDKLLKLKAKLTDQVASDCGVAPLSTRNLIRIVRRLVLSGVNLHDAICEILVADLLPPSQRAALESVLEQLKIQRQVDANHVTPETTIQIDEGRVTIGDFTMERKTVRRPEMVPAPKFFDIPSHVVAIKDLLQDWSGGERAFLLLGNQGVGKNVITDRLCQVANLEREYIQLHRDSTIGQITLQPSLENGKIVWHDSPLVRAVEQGIALVVDEADKAPTEVLAVLKGLVEDGELLLGDGRRLSSHETGPGIIPIHPDFTLWVLANRPGFPFLGNAFFRQIGDCFSTRVILNPDFQSEVNLLQSYGPSLDPKLIRSIAGGFSELRALADHGDLSYPYSTREALAVVKHLERYPEDTVITALHNVLDFDSFDASVYGTIGRVFQRHGIAVEDYASWQKAILEQGRNLRIEFGDERGSEGSSSNPPPLDDPKEGKWDEKNEAHVGGNTWAGGTGGSNTAGLGGRGGPYRLDRGHRVHQVSDQAKAEVSEEAARAARAMAQKALNKRLKEIDMSESEWDMYQKFVEPIKKDISSLKATLGHIDLKQPETGWIKRQSHGEIDESRLVDGVTGERNIYKRRSRADNESPILSPKRIRFVVDVSGSMYRFNGYDSRLVRCLEATNLIMESFDGLQQRFDYSIVGHSGDSPCIPFVDFGNPANNEKTRMKILQSMIAHSQFCRAGDFTLEAIEEAIDNVNSLLRNTGDDQEGLVIAISDANLERYGIHPRELGRIIDDGIAKGVKAHCIFIASFGREADEIRQNLPVGRGHVCMQTSDLPKIVRNILVSQM